jgi:hypothetical protein
METQKARWMPFVRTTHIYLTMMALLLFLFFGATGFMLNHGDWFGLEEVRTKESKGTLPAAILRPLDKLAVVEKLRAEFGAAGGLDAFEEEPDRLRAVFLRPGGRTEAVIERADGSVVATTETRGIATVLTDLHRGAGTGGAWKLLIDGASLLLLAAALTGLTLWLSLPRRRRVGLMTLAAGVLVSVLTYVLLVP